MSFYHFQSHSLEKGRKTWVTEVAGLSIFYYAVSLGKAIEGFILCQNHSVLMHLQVEKS